MGTGWDQTGPGGRYSKRGSGCWQTLLIPQGSCPAFAEGSWWQPALAPGPPCLQQGTGLPVLGSEPSS